MKLSFATKLTASYLFVVGVTLLFSAWFLTPRLERRIATDLETSLRAQADLVGRLLEAGKPGAGTAMLQAEAATLGKAHGARITVLDRSGRTVADSEGGTPPPAGEVVQVTVPAAFSADYAVRLAVPIATLRERIHRFQRDFVYAGLAAFGVALIVSLISVRRIAQPLQDLIVKASDIGRGHYDRPIRLDSHDEFGALADTLNEMAARISSKITELNLERSRLSTILATLTEGVIAVDQHQRVMLLNPAAERLFLVRARDVEGRPFLEALRHSALTDILARTLQGQPIVQEITVHRPDEHTLVAHALPMTFAPGEQGALVALHDISELRRLERVRHEFVANASHELKTPLTSIKGFVETLLDGAVDDPQHNREFLRTIGEQTQRLMRLIEDLLDFSSIEGRKTVYRFEPVALEPVLGRLLQALEPQARTQNVRLDKQLPVDLPPVFADRERLSQILLNLLDNAIKFNRSGGRVSVGAGLRDGQVDIWVEDNGPGIAEADLPRIFERFFRGDRSHNNAVPGTGLGLAIVKHLVEAHHGTINAVSRPGHGSRFTVTLPRA